MSKKSPTISFDDTSPREAARQRSFFGYRRFGTCAVTSCDFGAHLIGDLL